MVSEPKKCYFAKSFAQESEYVIINKSARVAPPICKVVIICGGFSSKHIFIGPMGGLSIYCPGNGTSQFGQGRDIRASFFGEMQLIEFSFQPALGGNIYSSLCLYVPIVLQIIK